MKLDGFKLSFAGMVIIVQFEKGWLKMLVVLTPARPHSNGASINAVPFILA